MARGWPRLAEFVVRQYYRANDTYNESPQMLGILFDKPFLLSVSIALENTRAECCQQLDKCGTHTQQQRYPLKQDCLQLL